jgi:AcrR family transcriptional regulator
MINDDDPRVKRTRSLIQQAFITIAKEKGFDAVTIKDIAERATINRATFYAHYEDKYALLKDLTERAFRQSVAKYLKPSDTFTQETCRQLILLTCEYVTQFYETCKLDTESAGALIDERVRQILQEKIEKMLLSEQQPTVKMQMITSVIGAAVYAAAFQISKSNPKDADGLIDDTVFFLWAWLQAV